MGDPNQSVLGFAGASPAFLLELCERPDFETVQLDLNYRSAASLVAAAAGFVASTAPGQRHVRDVRASFITSQLKEINRRTLRKLFSRCKTNSRPAFHPGRSRCSIRERVHS